MTVRVNFKQDQCKILSDIFWAESFNGKSIESDLVVFQWKVNLEVKRERDSLTIDFILKISNAHPRAVDWLVILWGPQSFVPKSDCHSLMRHTKMKGY